MANGTSSIIVDDALARAYNAAPKTTQKKSQAAMRQTLSSWRSHASSNNVAKTLKPAEPNQSARLSKQETEIFLKINRTLPEEKQLRFEQLNEKRLNDQLNRREFSELENLIRELEQIGVERLQAVIELAQLRKVEPVTLIKQLELEPLVQNSPI